MGNELNVLFVLFELIAIVLIGSLLAIAVKFAFCMPELTLKTAAISGAVAITTVGLAYTPLVGPLGPYLNLNQAIAFFTFLISSLGVIMSLGAVGFHYLARRFLKGKTVDSSS
jgi:hypothetical protein